jgi:hypothetical protein
LFARSEKDTTNLRSLLLLGSLSTAAAAVTKQTGLYVMALYPIFAYLWVLRGRNEIGLRQAFTWLAPQFLLALLIVVPWYAYMEYRILFGGNVSNIQFVINDIYNGQTLPERFVAAVDGIGIYAWVFLFALVSLLVLDSSFRQLLILMVFPFSILWAFFLSYEARNLAVAMPLLALSVGTAVEAWVPRVRGALSGRKAVRGPLYVPILGAMALVALGTLFFSEDVIMARQVSEQRQIFQPELNQKIYRYFASHNGPEPIITSYPVGWLPDLEPYWEYDRFQSLGAFHNSLERHPDITLLLIPLHEASPVITEEIQQNILSGFYSLEFTEGNYILVRIPPR